MTATLDISGVGTYNMTVNADNTVSVTVTNVPLGEHTFTITYYYQGSVILAQASTTNTINSGQTTTINFASSDLNVSFDNDSDGFTNLFEVKSEAGSDPNDPNSTPWTHPADITDNISPNGQYASNARVAMDDNGNAVIVWRQSDGANDQIYKSEYR